DLSRPQSGGHLVQQQDARTRRVGARQFQPLAFEDTEVPPDAIDLAAEAEALGNLFRARRRLTHVPYPAEHGDPDGFQNAELRKRTCDLEGARDALVAKLARRIAEHACTVQPDHSAVRRKRAGNDIE